jgi:hypothetical protein
MFISVIHRISDPDAFAATAANAMKDIPADLKLHQAMTGDDRSTAVCLWEAPTVDSVRNLLDPLFEASCKNEYVAIDASNSMGLPTVASTTA